MFTLKIQMTSHEFLLLDKLMRAGLDMLENLNDFGASIYGEFADYQDFTSKVLTIAAESMANSLKGKDHAY